MFTSKISVYSYRLDISLNKKKKEKETWPCFKKIELHFLNIEYSIGIHDR